MFDDATRAEIIAKHNEYRSQISHGTAKYMGGNTLKSGKNVYELVTVIELFESWDCGLEQSAQDWSDKCKSSASRPNNFGENFNLFAANGSVEVAMEAMEEWWAELEQYDASSNPDIIFNDDVFNYAESWSQVYETVLLFS
ncbi:unnamed protein product [Toxocara canis]|uniref:SCP domain-containing protein n=1 Tax=Toxocara canis TaxID=6265 RepID=A0A183U6Y2_TOXCA|nr:unnamed protein product [Toxocara canis]